MNIGKKNSFNSLSSLEISGEEYNYFSLINDWGHGIYKKLVFNNNYIDNRKNIIYEKKFNN